MQGLRATTRGGHIAVITSVKAQFNDRGRARGVQPPPRAAPSTQPHRVPRPRLPGIEPDDARQALDTARAVIDAADRLLDSAHLSTFD